MPAVASPFFGITYGWVTGESGWGDPTNTNFKVLSFLDKGAVDAFVGVLPGAPSEGDSVVYTVDNQFYVRIGGAWLFILPQSGMEINETSTGKRWKYSGSWAEIPTTTVLQQFDTDLQNNSDITKGAYKVGRRGRNVGTSLDDFVNVKDRGAIGNGIANDGAAITAAEASVAAAGGGSLVYPPGTYLGDPAVSNTGNVMREYNGPNTVINAYAPADAFGFASKAFKYSDSTTRTGKAGYTVYVESRPRGSTDPTVPGSDFGLGVSILKQNWQTSQVMGQACGVDVVTRGGHFLNPVSITGITKANPAVVTTATAHGWSNGDTIILQHVGGMTQIEDICKFTIANVTTFTFQLLGINSTAFTTYTTGGIAHKQSGSPFLFSPGDTAGYINNTVQSSASNFSAILEGVAYYMPGGDQIYGTVGIRVQLGAIKKSEQLAIGVLCVAENGACGPAVQIQNSRPLGLEASWSKAISYLFDGGAGAYEAFSVNQLGHIILNGGGVTTPKKLIRANTVTGNFEIINNAASAVIFTVTDTGVVNIPLGAAITINGVQVVAARDNGWTAMTGTANKATAYASGTITLIQLAERVKALQDALTTHGLIGP